MATVYGVNKTKLNEAIGSNVIETGTNNAKVGYIYDEYEAAALAAADVIQVGDLLPNGARIVNINVAFDDLGTGATIDVGDLADDDRYASAIDVATAAGEWQLAENFTAANLGYRVGTATNDNQIAITVNTSAATGTIKIAIVYAF